MPAPRSLRLFGTGLVGAVGLAAVLVPSSAFGAGSPARVTAPAGAPARVAAPAVAPAPAGFRQAVLGLTDEMASLGNANPTLTRLKVPQRAAQTRSAVVELSDKDLATLYAAMQGSTSPAQLTSTYATLQRSAAAQGHPAGQTSAAPRQRLSASAATGAVTASLAQPPSCPDGAPGGAAAVATAETAAIALEDVAKVIPHDVVAGLIVAGEGAVVTAPDPAYLTAEGLAIAAEVTAAGLKFAQDVNDDCLVSGDQALTRQISDKIDALNALVDSRTTTLLSKSDALNALIDSRTTTLLTKSDALNALVDTRTTTLITNVATAQKSLDQQLRLSIQQNLSTIPAPATVASYELPASVGGYLDSTPIGVKQIVTDTLAQMQAAKQSVAPSTAADLAAANAALAKGSYKTAYNLYQKTYQDIAK